MAQLVIAAGASVGVAISAAAASTIASTAISIGIGLAQRALTPDQVVKQEGSRLSESQITTSAEGSPIVELRGRSRIGGQLFWATTFKETVITSSQSQGGKGGPKAITESTEYVYSVSFAIGLCASDGGVSLGRIWADGKILDLSNITYRFYDGSSDQLPDPKIEAVEGAGTVPANRGLSYIVFEDLPLADFGNRIPQITCEVNRAVSTESDSAMENALQAVNIIPGAGEFIYGTEAYSTDDGEGGSDTENSHNSAGSTDFVASLNNLEQLAPNVGSASLVVSWFGSSLDATTCEVRPKVDNATKTVSPDIWVVSSTTRADAEVVSTYEGAPAFGGTPSDQTVREAVIEMKSRGLRVMFYPFMLMDFATYPWRGNVVGDPANFIGTAVASDFTRLATDTTNAVIVGYVLEGEAEVPVYEKIYDEFPLHYVVPAGSVIYDGPDEWTHRRLILHYATLLGDLLTAGDAFLVGSEMAGLSAEQVAWGTGLATLMSDVTAPLAAGVNVSYAADWSEYDEPNLDPAWSAADFIGIDWYLPLTDWRVTADETYTRDHFKNGVTSGEYWDYFYEDEEARNSNTRTAITSDEFRQKNIDYWRNSEHPGKPIWLTEFGCPAVDKGGNQPNVFPDPKSSESQIPWFSNGDRNDTVQRLYVEALLEYFGENSSIVDPANMFVWTWDARPFPAFPSDTGTWADAENWATGHWLTGRMGGASVADTVTELCANAGIPSSEIDVTGLATVSTRVRGMATTSLTSPSAVIENMMDTYLFDAYETGEKLVFVARSVSNLVTVDIEDLVGSGGQDTFSLKRMKDTELPDRVKVDYVDELRDHNVASVDSHTVTGFSRRVRAFNSLNVLSTEYARALADTLVHEQWISRNTVEFTLPFSSESSGETYLTDMTPGASFRFLDRLYRIRQLTFGDDIEVSAVGYNTNVYEPVEHASAEVTSDSTITFGKSFVEFMDIPLRDTDGPNQWSPRIATRQTPWPGQVLFYREDGSGGHNLNTTAKVDTVIGETTTDFDKGTPWVWDNANEVTVRLYDPTESLASLSDLSVLNGANAMLIETPSGEWEVFQFVNATLNGDGTYTLSRLLRGQMGTEAYMGDPTPAGARVVMYDTERFTYLEGTSANLGVDMMLRYGPSGVLIGDSRYSDETVTPRGVAFRPYAPVDLKQVLSGSDLVLNWVRRTRYDGDAWDVVDVPLNEEYERYEVDIFDGEDVVRTLVVDNTTTVTYTAAQQTTDFGSTQSSVAWVVHQMSATFGRGAPAND